MKKTGSISAFSAFLVISLASLHHSYSLFSRSQNIWDGMLLNYGLEHEQARVQEWLFSSGWVLQWYFLDALNYISVLLGVSFELVNDFFVLILLGLLAREVFLWSFRVLDLPRPEALWLVATSLTFPALVVLQSSIMSFHLSSLLLTSLVVRSLGLRKQLWALLLLHGSLLIAFQYNAAITVSLALVYLLQFCASGKDGSLPPPSKNFWIIGFLGTVYLVWDRILTPSWGHYEGYNALPSLSLGSLFDLAHVLILFSSFGLPVALFWGFELTRSILLGSIPSQARILSHVIVALTLLLMAILPFVAALKHASLFGAFDWNARQALPLALILPITLGLLLRALDAKTNPDKIRVAPKRPTALAAVSIVFLGLSTLGTLDILNRIDLDRGLVEYLQSSSVAQSGSAVLVQYPDWVRPQLREYEAEVLGFMASGKSPDLTSVGWGSPEGLSALICVRLSHSAEPVTVANRIKNVFVGGAVTFEEFKCP